MLPAQLDTVRWILRSRADIFHHGDCIGADAQAHEIAEELGLLVVIHPPLDSSKRAWCESEYIREPKAYLERNEDIVLATELLIVAPRGFSEMRRSGTWATARAAQKIGRPTIVVWPNGSVHRREQR
jgi:hypothetical protein